MDTNENKFQCSGDCLRCTSGQRQYCSSQHAYNSMRLLQTLQTTMAAIQEVVTDLKNQIEKMQTNDSMIFNPSAQSGVAAHPIGSPYNQ